MNSVIFATVNSIILATVLSHFMILSGIFATTNSVIFATVNSVILWFCQPFSRSYQSFCYSAQLFYDFVSHSRDTINHFCTVLIHFTKFLCLSAIFWMTTVGLQGGRWLVARSRGVGRALGSCEGAQGRSARSRTSAGARRAGWLGQLIESVDLGDRSLVHHPR
jgi:hypothetical protein